MSFEPPSDDLIRQVFPQVEELALVDKGGFKLVYRIVTGSKIEALKLILIPSYPGNPDADLLRQENIGRVHREVEALAYCTGQEVVKLGSLQLAAVNLGGSDYVAYSEEFLEGDDLWKLLNSGTPKPTEHELRLLFATLLKAIRELWSHGYVHRDIKPKNVMKLNDPSRKFVLLDLGIAYSVQETALTVNPGERLPLATYRYLAPEMMNPNFRETIDYRSDLYTAAMTVFEYGAQRHPLARNKDDMMRTISRALHQQAQPLLKLRPDLSTQFCQTIDQLLKKKPALRPANLNLLITRMESGL
jgi:eukaryotic-like serine/threonine-protein kinase